MLQNLFNNGELGLRPPEGALPKPLPPPAAQSDGGVTSAASPRAFAQATSAILASKSVTFGSLVSPQKTRHLTPETDRPSENTLAGSADQAVRRV